MRSDRLEAVTQEFLISVTPVGEDHYSVRTERVAPGVPLAEELLVWPVTAWLTQAAPLMNSDEHLGADERPGAPLQLNLASLGQQLYNALFQGTIRDSWMTAQEIAQARHNVLSLRLILKETRLALLPWEALHVGVREACAQRDRSLVVELDLLDESDWDRGFDEIEYDDPTYEEDAAVVSELFISIPGRVSSETPLTSIETVPQGVNKDGGAGEAEGAGGAEEGREVSKAEGVSPPLSPPAPLALFIVGAIAVLLLSWWWFQNRQPQRSPNLTPIPPSSLPTSAELNLQKTSTKDLSAIAFRGYPIKQLNRFVG